MHKLTSREPSFVPKKSFLIDFMAFKYVPKTFWNFLDITRCFLSLSLLSFYLLNPILNAKKRKKRYNTYLKRYHYFTVEIFVIKQSFNFFRKISFTNKTRKEKKSCPQVKITESFLNVLLKVAILSPTILKNEEKTHSSNKKKYVSCIYSSLYKLMCIIVYH